MFIRNQLVERSLTNSEEVYFLIRQAINTLDRTPIRGRMYAKSPALPLASLSPPSIVEEVAAFVRLPIDVFCKIMGTQPKMDGMRKSTKYLTSVAASE
jgi:hypothetical protein